ncbi:MAG: biopolymer transporter ExbD [Planctomycetes bacterium]|nr:biopolymer transporter ExbD [Planctomycetota bacterium]
MAAIGGAGKKQNYEMGMNMTPMIDVVFNLIIFFMIVTDLTQQELEELVLPKADMAMKDENPPEKRMIINITRPGHYVVKRNDRGLVDDCMDKIRIHLSSMVEFFPREEDGCSEQPVLIRADKHTEFKYIQKVLQICGEEGIKIYKIELACSVEEDKAEGEK